MLLKVIVFLFPFIVFGAEIPFLKPSFFDLPSDIEESKEEGKYFFIMFHQEGCPFCEKMRKITFRDPKVAEYFKKHFYMIEINIKGSLPVIDVDGKEYTEKSFSRKHGVRSTPYFIFYDQNGNVILKLPGYYRPEEFLLIGKFIVEGHYKKENIFKFMRRMRSKEK